MRHQDFLINSFLLLLLNAAMLASLFAVPDDICSLYLSLNSLLRLFDLVIFFFFVLLGCWSYVPVQLCMYPFYNRNDQQ